MEVVVEGDQAWTRTETWRILKSGRESDRVFSADKEVFGKNLGKKNATSALTQAIRNCQSMMNKFEDKGYWQFGMQEPVKLPLPMLAQLYDDRKHYLRFPVAVQPKLDGMRMLFDGEKGWSRNGKIMLPGVSDQFKMDTRGLILDGELILPPPYTFQESMSAAKKVGPLTPLLTYQVYDCLDTDLGFDDRFKQLLDLFPGNVDPTTRKVNLVSTSIAHNEGDIKSNHTTYTNHGYEGTMIRNLAGQYRTNFRSNDLQKYKDFLDGEFEIVRIESGEGKHEGLAIFVCVTEEGKEFKASGMDDGVRRVIYTDQEDYIGKLLTVKYQGLSDDGIPRFPNALRLREDE